MLLAEEPAEEGLFPGFAVYFGYGFGQGDGFGAGLDAILGVGAFFDAAFAEEGLDAFFGVHGAGGVHIEEADLADDGGADEIVAGVYLRADFEAEAAGHAAGERVTFFLDFRGDAGTFAEAVGAVNGDPGLHALEGIEHELAIDSEVAHDRELGHRLDGDWLRELIHEGRAGHFDLAVDDHGAGAADFFEAVGVVGDGGGFFAVAGDGIFGDVTETDDDVHGGAPAEGEFFPVGGLAWGGLAFDF